MAENKIDLLKTIQLKYKDLSKGHKLIAQYIISYYDKAAFMTASKLGLKVNVSESTVVRFATSLGYSGYPSLQRALQELIKNKLTTVQRLDLANDFSDKEALYRKIIRADIDNIKATLDEMDYEKFENVLNHICNAKKVYILGLRSSSSLAGYLGFYLSFLIDYVKVVSFGMSDVFEQLLRVNNDDLVIAISYPRYSKKTLDVLEYVKKQNCKIVGITDSLLSPVANVSDYTLIARSDMISFVDSLVAPMSLINAIIIAIGMKKRTETTEYLTKLEDIWKEYHIYNSSEKGELFY